MVKLDKFTQFHTFEIWHPLYSEDRVLLKCTKVGTHNKVIFTKARSLGTDPYYVSGKVVRKYPKRYNNSIWCYAVPMHELQPLELSENSVMELY